jgi:hypothetical protein
MSTLEGAGRVSTGHCQCYEVLFTKIGLHATWNSTQQAVAVVD